MSEVKVNKISPRTACGTVTLGDSGDTIAIGAGVTTTGMGRTGTVNWDTASIKTATFTAVSGNGYFVNTTGGVVTVNLPAGSAGDIIGLKDYAGTWDSNAVTLNPNGSEKIGGGSDVDPTLESEGGAVLLVYVDGIQGWLTTQESVTASPSGVETFITATGGTPCSGAICGDCKVHTFTGPGTFCVSVGATCAANNVVSYLVVAGGGSGGSNTGNSSGGGGAGGFREYKSPVTPYTASPLDGNPGGTAITVSATGYPICVGGGGATVSTAINGNNGSPSTFSSITSTAGGYGATGLGAGSTGGPGGSGGGGGGGSPGKVGGTGNTPPTTPAQGFTGGTGGATSPDHSGGGGGGATELGVSAAPGTPGRGGAGATTEISGSSLAYSGGAGSAASPGAGAPGSPCGTGGAGSCAGTAGTINRGGGGGGAGPSSPNISGLGGSGVVIIRYKFQ